ncbi:MAG: outer membrane lipoprotein-sorting protein [Verrucomicrobiota bacterium]
MSKIIFPRRLWALVIILFCRVDLAESPPPEPANGAELATQLREAQPVENSEISGVLKIRAPHRREDIPVVCKVVTNGNTWQVIYETRATTSSGAEKLVVIHSLDGHNQYLYARAASPQSPLPETKSLAPADASIQLAGSDFWLTELGLDFFHWPQQKKLKGEMRLGQPCYVLESVNPGAATVVRVKSYIDKESGSPLIAEGFDRNGKLVKEFSLGGSSFKKIDGRWQLKKMKITSPRNDSETVLEFDLPKD